MKKLPLFFLFVLFFTSSFGQYKFSLEITTKTLSNKQVILAIYNNVDWNPIRIDSFIFSNGRQIINGEMKQPTSFSSLGVSHNGKSIYSNFFLDSGKNNLSIEYPSDESRNLTLVSDTRGNFIFQDLNSIFSKAVADYPGAKGNGFIKRTPEFDREVYKNQRKRLEVYPNDFASLLYLYRMSRIDASISSSKDILATFAKLNDNIKNTLLGKQLYLEQETIIAGKVGTSEGNIVPIFQITDIHNKKFSNGSLKGQPYLIAFSATWCGPCQEALPKLKKMYDTYKPKGLKIIYFNDDDNIIRWKEHVSKNNLTWINVSEKLKPSKSKIPKSFGVYAIPTYLVIDKNGYIIYNSDQSDTSGKNLETFLRKATSD